MMSANGGGVYRCQPRRRSMCRPSKYGCGFRRRRNRRRCLARFGFAPRPRAFPGELLPSSVEIDAPGGIEEPNTLPSGLLVRGPQVAHRLDYCCAVVGV